MKGLVFKVRVNLLHRKTKEYVAVMMAAEGKGFNISSIQRLQPPYTQPPQHPFITILQQHLKGVLHRFALSFV